MTVRSMSGIKFVGVLFFLVLSHCSLTICFAQTVDELQQARIAIYTEIVEAASARHKIGDGSPQDVFEAKVMLLDAKIDAASTARTRLELLKQKVMVLAELETIQESFFNDGRLSGKEIRITAARKVEAQIAVVKATAAENPQAVSAQTGIEKLAADQLAAYNRADLDAFCACYHPEVRVFDGEKEKPAGIEAFRKRYEKMFQKGGFSATVSQRVVHGDHCVDLEHWQRDNGKKGTVLVRYTEKDGRIGIVQFLR